MDIRDITVDAIILKSRPYKEQDKLLTYYALEHGKGVAIARGACKSGSKLSGAAQPFCRVLLTLSPPKNGVSYVSQAMPDTSYITLDAQLSAIAYASYIGELADIALPTGKPSRSFFVLLLTVFSLLKMDDDPARTARFFELQLMAELGILPDLSQCEKCGRGLAGGMFHLSAKKGALLCASCGESDPSPLICAGTIQTMRRMLEAPVTKIPSIRLNPVIMQEMEAAFSCFLDYHLEYSSNAKKVLKQLLD